MRLGGLRIQMSTTGRRTLNTVSDTGVDKLQILLYVGWSESSICSFGRPRLLHQANYPNLPRFAEWSFFPQNQRTESTESELINCVDVFYKIINTEHCWKQSFGKYSSSNKISFMIVKRWLTTLNYSVTVPVNRKNSANWESTKNH